MAIKSGIKIRLIVVIGILTVAAGISGLLYLYVRSAGEPVSIKTYFDYSPAEISRLRSLESDKLMTVEEASEWDEKAFQFVESLALPDIDASKVYAYQNVAQLDAIALSYQAHGTFAGDLSAVSKGVLCEVHKVRCNEVVSEVSDEYSKALADIIIPKVAARIAQDNRQLKPSVLKNNPQYWDGPAPQTGLTAASYKTWLISSASQFRAASPPKADSTLMRDQLNFVKQTLTDITLEQKNSVVAWAGGPGTQTPPGQWLDSAELYMRDKNMPLETYASVRAVLSMAVADAAIAVYDSKYTYQTKRPAMVDKSIVTIMPTPNHPSYPAGHSTISWAAATVLNHYLPEAQPDWDNNAKLAGDSRILGGIHFPVDIDAGTAQGKLVGNEVVRKWQ